MSLRHITAGLLVVLLFCGAAWSGLCSLRCELRHDASAMRQAVGDHAMAMPMGHCHGMTIGTELVPGEMASAVCPASVCGHAVVSAAVAGQRGVSAPGGPETAMAQSVLRMPPQAWVAARALEPPPRPPVGFDPVLVSLRV